MEDRPVAYSFAQGESVLRAFYSSDECRRALRNQPASVSVVVCNKGAITPINLAAALCADEPERDVYLLVNDPDESLAFRARAARIRGLLNKDQASSLLGIDSEVLAGQAIRLPDIDCAVLAGQAAVFCREVRPQLEGLPKFDTAIPLAHTACTVDTAPRTVEHAPRTVELAPRMIEHTGMGRIVAFLSGRGGVGKSTVALMTALSAQSRGKRVALVDLDLQFGDLDYLAGNEPSSRIQRFLLEQAARETSRLSLSEQALTLIIPPKRPELGEAHLSAIPLLLQRLADQRDLVVVNTGSFLTEVHAQIAQCCNHLIFLMDQRATSIEACRQVVDLCIRMRLPQARFLYLLNGCGRHAALTPMDVTLALGGAEVFGLADGGSLVDELLALGCPMELLKSGNAFVNSLEVFLDSLIGQQQKATTGSYAVDERGRARLFEPRFFRHLLRRPQHVAT